MLRVAAAIGLILPLVSPGGQSVSYQTAARQIAAAVSPLPEPLQKGAADETRCPGDESGPIAPEGGRHAHTRQGGAPLLQRD